MKKRLYIYGSLLSIFLSSVIGFSVWSPGDNIVSAKNSGNAIWLSHGWFGSDSWFKKHKKNKDDYSQEKKQKMVKQLRQLKVKFIYPHLCPANGFGKIPDINWNSINDFKTHNPDIKILPWVGGSTDSTVDLSDPKWRNQFIADAAYLLENPNIDGIHLNFEPLNSGNSDLPLLLKALYEFKNNKIISIAAYPPPTIFHPHDSVHWNLKYYKDLSQYVDQFVPMMYDTALRNKKLYINLMRQWTVELNSVVGHKDLIFGIPAYEDFGVGYHDPIVENVENALLGIFAGVNECGVKSYSLGIYSEWTLQENEILHIMKSTHQGD